MGEIARWVVLASVVLGSGCYFEDNVDHCDEIYIVDNKWPESTAAAPGFGSAAEAIDSTPGQVQGGTLEPSLIPLSDAQIAAIGHLGNCTGTLIGDRWVLTARHCQVADSGSFCIGDSYDTAETCIPFARVYDHGRADVTLIELADEARAYMSDIEPIPMLAGTLGCEYVGEMAESAGFGASANVEFGHRYFTAEPIVAIMQEHVAIHGLGVQGLCRGDSGAPLLVTDDAGAPRVAGVLSNGHISCRERDEFWRVDQVSEWAAEKSGGAVGTAELRP